MCDYSLYAYPNRLAEAGEILVASRCSVGSLGFRAEADTKTPGTPEVFVCVPPGAQMVLYDIPQRLQDELGVSASEPVVFTQLNIDNYRDGVRFQNGQEILLQRFSEGLRALVLSVDSREQERPIVTQPRAEQFESAID